MAHILNACIAACAVVVVVVVVVAVVVVIVVIGRNIVTCTVCWGGGVFFARAVVHTYTECMHCNLCCDGGGGGYYVYFMHTKTELMIWSFHLV